MHVDLGGVAVACRCGAAAVILRCAYGGVGVARDGFKVCVLCSWCSQVKLRMRCGTSTSGVGRIELNIVSIYVLV